MKKLLKNILRYYGYQIKKLDNGFSFNHNIEWLKNQNINIVFDIGANEGQFAEFITVQLNNPKIYSFEPISSCYNILSGKTSILKNVEAFNFALGDKNGTTEIYENEFTPSSSIMPMKEEHTKNFPFTLNTKKITIDIKTLDDFVNDKKLSGKILVKIDVQGYESKVISGGINFISNNVNIIIIETSIIELYENEASFEQIYDTLKKLGFKYHGNLNQLYSPIDGEILQVDAIFIK